MFEFFSVRIGEEPSRTKQDVAYREVLKRDPCSYCNAVGVPMVSDHIQPQAFSSERGWENLTAACRSCNAAKGSKTVLAFLTGEPIGIDHWVANEQRMRQSWAREGGYFDAYMERWAA